jgi:hypothetical protein
MRHHRILAWGFSRRRVCRVAQDSMALADIRRMAQKLRRGPTMFRTISYRRLLGVLSLLVGASAVCAAGDLPTKSAFATEAQALRANYLRPTTAVPQPPVRSRYCKTCARSLASWRGVPRSSSRPATTRDQVANFLLQLRSVNSNAGKGPSDASGEGREMMPQNFARSA